MCSNLKLKSLLRENKVDNENRRNRRDMVTHLKKKESCEKETPKGTSGHENFQGINKSPEVKLGGEQNLCFEVKDKGTPKI